MLDNINEKRGIVQSMMNNTTEMEMDLAFESVFDFAMEAAGEKKIISKEVRDKLPDSAFGVIYKTKEGEVKKLYPLIVKGDKKTTELLIGRAIQYFNYCNPIYKEQLAKNIIKAMNNTGVVVKIHPRNAIRKYVDVPPKYMASDTKNEFNEKNKTTNK